MSRDWRLRVDDILHAAELAIGFVGEDDFAAFEQDEMKTSAVLHQISIIGEAAAHLPAEVRARVAHLPWHAIVGMRHAIVHGYFAIDLQILFATVRDDLPPLRDAMRALLASDSEEP